MSVAYYGLLVLLVLLLHGQAAAETTIEEYDNYLLVQIIGIPEQKTAESQSVSTSSDQQQELQGLREELHNLRLPQPGESPEQNRERKSKATVLLAKIRQLLHQQKGSTVVR